MQPFDIVNDPLEEGTNLIEAGAGTGKTYALTSIFLRLLLEKAIDPDRILVVTFTTAATAELRDRLRRQLLAVRRFLDGEGLLDDTLRKIVSRAGASPRTREKVGYALREFDRVAIFTIHGFCQRLLGEQAFETGSPFDIELLIDTSALIQSVADDYWRRVFHGTAPEIADFALARHWGPEPLAALYQRFSMPDLHLIPERPEWPRIDFDPYRRGCDALRRLWSTARSDITSRLHDPSLSGTVYGGLKPSPGAGPSRRVLKVEALCRALDHFLDRETVPLPPDPSLVFFTTDKIVASTRKGKTPPTHAFFDACQVVLNTAGRLQGALEDWLTALRYDFFRFAATQLDQIKQAGQTLFYDDLLVRVNRALEAGADRPLAAMVRRRYQAALVDEFQDTDTIQYAIFRRLFDTPTHLLFMIGDPKQAIYAFRGADIYSYLEAARHARRKFTLVENWRSQPELIRAINCLFGNRRQPFIIPDIRYRPAHAARQGDDVKTDGAPLVCWHMVRDDREVRSTQPAFNKQEAYARILPAVAGEIKRLLGRSDGNGHSPAWSAHDMAILVRTNRQARTVKAAMQDAGIPAVVHHAGSVFDTPEADDLLQILQAVVRPGDARRVKTALATRMFGTPGEKLVFGEPEPVWWNDIQQRFFDFHTMWREWGFYPFFQQMLTEYRVAERLLRLTDGERRLTNLLHLSELVQESVAAGRLDPQGTLRWLSEQKTKSAGRSEEQQLRLESDARAVTIITIHKSKGLEFPIVFCPFAWEAGAGPDEWPLFHDPAADMRRTLYLGAEADADCREWARTERRAEAMRLLYVAVTRARDRCYLVWGDLPGAPNSPLGYLLDADAPASIPNEKFQPPPEDATAGALALLARKAAGALAVRPLPAAETATAGAAESAPRLAPERRMTRRIDRDWAIASFSSLIRGPKAAGDVAEDRDQGISGEVSPAEGPSLAASDDKRPDAIHLFPKGAHAGNFFHRLFEVMDYGPSRQGVRSAAVAAELRHFGFDSKWEMPVTQLIERVLATPLPSAPAIFSLNRLEAQDCVKEMPFGFPLRPIKAQQLWAAFSHQPPPLFDEGLGHWLRKLDFTLSGGYLRGFIDLVFRHQGRYYLLDWKSNHLGDRFTAYNPLRLRDVMAEEYYFLQYHLYVLALDQYLRLRLPGYTYENDFGGVYYLFIRGMPPENDTGSGIFFDRPASGLVDALRASLLETGDDRPMSS
ncbi:MAG: exodeoxyribonuclease V subunit beta [Desulfobacterales bacterium]|nr:exodeoxyribonuclease V subunit beta [Desulfobacterales bacterium]